MNRSGLVASACPPLEATLVEQLIDEFNMAERRFVLGDWEPATLDGGQFSEVAARIVYHVDSGNLAPRKGVNDCLKYVEDPKGQLTHSFPQRRSALHLAKVLRTMYKFRSQRGAVHIDPDYTANEIDSTLVVAQMRWVMAEIIRLFSTASPSEIAKSIREITTFDVPAILATDGRLYVLATGCTLEEEVILVLHDAGDEGLAPETVVGAIPRPGGSVRSAISKLKGKDRRQVVQLDNGRLRLTQNGSKRLRDEISPKLTRSA